MLSAIMPTVKFKQIIAAYNLYKLSNLLLN